MYTSLALAATLAATVGQAFLIPPSISTADNDIVNALPFEHAVEAETRMLELDCPGCPVLASDLLGNPHTLQLENKLRLNFSVAHEEVDKLCLNGLAIHPMDILGFHGLTAPQIVRVGSEPSVAGSPQLGFHLSIGQPHQSSKTDQLHLYELELEIVEVAEKFVDGIPAVNLKFLKTPSGKIMISDLETVPSSKPSLPTPVSHDHGKECTSAICKWRAIIADKLSKLSKLKGCGSKVRPGHKRPKPHGHGRPRPEGAHRSRHRHHRKHGAFIRIMRSIVLHIVIPITIGIIAGITASLVGMVVGHLVVFVWRTLFRRGSKQRQYVKLQQEEIEECDVDAKGSPPDYEDTPAYEEGVLDEKSSE